MIKGHKIMAGTEMTEMDWVFTLSNRRNGGHQVKVATRSLQTKEESNLHRVVCIVLHVPKSYRCK